MIVFYFLKTLESVGSSNKQKIEKMCTGKKIFECHISKFTGRLLSSEYN